MPDENRYYGKYRGTVANNADPEGRGRIQVTVPEVTGDNPGSWALPCLPVLGREINLFSVPPVGAGVWVEFEQGRPDYPIWDGYYAQSGMNIPEVSGINIETAKKNSIVVSDLPSTPTDGGIVIKSTNGAMIVVNEGGIFIHNGKGASICLVGPVVSINEGALSVM